MKVLQVSMGESFGGIERLELDWCKKIGKDVQFDILTPNNVPFKDYVEEIKNAGGNLYDLKISRKKVRNRIVYAFRYWKFLKKNRYDVIHVNSSAFFFTMQISLISKLCNVNKVIVHAHSIPKVGRMKKILIWLLNPLLIKFSDVCLSCSKIAKSSLFSKSFIKKDKILVLKNGIDINEYKFNRSIREQYRNKFGFNDKNVYGFIGRFEKQKNPFLLIEVFNQIQLIQQNSVLLLIGDGCLKRKLAERVEELKIGDKVVFLGFRKDVNLLLNCIDALIMTSIYEGLGIVTVEAQTNGVYVYCTNAIPEEAHISKKFQYFDVNDTPEEIAKLICKDSFQTTSREEDYKNSIINGYDINDVCERLLKIYKGEI